MKLPSEIDVRFSAVNINFSNNSFSATIQWSVVGANPENTPPMTNQNISGVIPDFLREDLSKVMEKWLVHSFAMKAMSGGG